MITCALRAFHSRSVKQLLPNISFEIQTKIIDFLTKHGWLKWQKHDHPDVDLILSMILPENDFSQKLSVYLEEKIGFSCSSREYGREENLGNTNSSLCVPLLCQGSNNTLQTAIISILFFLLFLFIIIWVYRDLTRDISHRNNLMNKKCD